VTGTGKKQANKQELLREAVELSYKSDFRKAEEDLNACIMLDPDDPVCYWRKADNRYFESRYSQNDDAPKFDEKAYQELLSLIDTAMRHADEKIAEGQNVDFYLYMKARLMGVKGAAQYGHGDIGKYEAVLLAKKTYKLVEPSQYTDVPSITGVINFKVGSYNWVVRQMAAWAGLPGDRRRGLDLMIDAANKEPSDIFHNDTRFLVIIAYTPAPVAKNKKKEIERYREAEVMKMYAYLNEQYPKNKVLVKFRTERGLSK
jgi:tetratricopeptide (TPR) repeat protein